jgi:regulator of sigma E protease
VSLDLNLSNIVAFIVMLGGLIFVHEFGHFVMAKFFKIRVEVFSLGFGPRLLGWRRNCTDYRISLLPLGGYVKMAGENPGEELSGSEEEFLSRSKWERFVVLVMGATLNIVLAVIINAGVYMYGVPVPKYIEDPPVVGAVESGSPAERGGLRVMDRILQVGDQQTRSWNEMQIAVALNPDQRLPFIVDRDGEEITVDITIGRTEREAMGRVGILPYVPRMRVGDVRPGGPAETAGLRDGDYLLAVDGLDVGLHLEEVARLLSENLDRPVDLSISRGAEQIVLSLLPRAGAQGRSDPGFTLRSETTLRKYGFLQASVESLKLNWRQASLLFTTLKKLVVGQLSPRTLSGPIEIYRFTGEAWRSGAMAFFRMMALISLQLGIINLLPIPVLDGGHIFILGLEGVIRRDLSLMVKERVMQVGLVLLLLIMGTVISLDIVKNLF